MKIFSKKFYARKQGICKGWHDEKCRKTKKAERESQSAYVILSGKEKSVAKGSVSYAAHVQSKAKKG